MSEYDNELRGVLFENDKQGNEKRPDYTGEATISGQKYRMAAWSKTSKNGKNFLSVNLELDDGTRQSQANGGGSSQPVSDEIPF